LINASLRRPPSTSSTPAVAGRGLVDELAQPGVQAPFDGSGGRVGAAAAQVPLELPAFARFRLKHQLGIDGNFDDVADDDAGSLAREFPLKAKVFPID
jgi:hypothetical protein